jgi:hypothetical protein
MSASQKLNKLIELYLNDINDYHDDNDIVLAEDTLSPIVKLMQESDKSPEEILKETISNSSPKQKEIIKDFIVYTKNI